MNDVVADGLRVDKYGVNDNTLETDGHRFMESILAGYIDNKKCQQDCG